MTELTKKVGYRIRKLREAKDFNQSQMADLLKLTPGAYAKIERGETDPSISRLFQIAVILKVDVVRFIKDPVEPGTVDLTAIQQQLHVFAKDLEQLKKRDAQTKASRKK